MENSDWELELNDLRYDSNFDPDFDSTTEIEREEKEFNEQLILRSTPKPARINREIRRLAEPYQPATDWVQSLVARFTKCPNEVIFDTELTDGEVRVLLALLALDCNEKGWSEHSEETMAGLVGKKVRQFRNILTSLRKKDKVFQQRRGDYKTAKLYTKIRVERSAIVNGYKHD